VLKQIVTARIGGIRKKKDTTFTRVGTYIVATIYLQHLPEVLLTQFVSPDDEHDVLETCRELKI